MSVLVYVEQFNGKAAPVSWEVLGKGRQLATRMGGKLAAVVIGNGVEAVAQEAISYGADIVHLVEDRTVVLRVDSMKITVDKSAIARVQRDETARPESK